jgi:hypothetical protein
MQEWRAAGGALKQGGSAQCVREAPEQAKGQALGPMLASMADWPHDGALPALLRQPSCATAFHSSAQA